MNIVYEFHNNGRYDWRCLGEAEAERRISDLVNAKGYTEEQAINEV